MAKRGPPHRKGSHPSSASSKYPSQFQVVKSGIESYIGEYAAWPFAPFKLELETAGVYQDVTGQCLSELYDKGSIDFASFDSHKYVVGPGPASPPDNIREATNTFYDFFSDQENAYFGELGAYVGICKVYDELDVSMDVHPKGNYPRKFRGNDIELDAFIEIFQERFPVEVYNGFQFVDDEHNKISEINDLDIDAEIMSNPILVNRLASPFAKKEAPKNGLIIDTRSILACEANNPDLKQAVEKLNINQHFDIIPKFTTSGSIQLDGYEYDNKAGDYVEVAPSKMVSAASNLPDSYLRRLRGGVQFQYVSTLFRRAAEPVDQIAATVTQDIYHHLLRHPKGTPREDIIDIGWNSYRERHTRVKTEVSRFEPDIRARTGELLDRLTSDNIIIERDGKLYARKSLHPHASLDFNP